MTNTELTGKTILIAEDEEDLRALWAEYLMDHGCEVLTVSNGHAAIKLIEEREKDLGHPHLEAIISDWMMPGLDGPGLLKKLRSNTTWASIPFLMVSGKVTRDILQQMISTGVDAVLLKPFETSALANKVVEAIQRRQELELKSLFDN